MSQHHLTPLILAATAATCLAGEPSPSTFCNPLPLPNYPIGRMSRDITHGEPPDTTGLWLVDRKEHYRELADPSALWFDVGLDPKSGVNLGPFRYRVEIETTPDQWSTLLDRSNNTEDLLIDYRETPPQAGSRVRLVILGWPKGITPGVVEFTAFGKTRKSASP